jgi:GDP-mannose 6-dehydrogenase
MMNLKFAIVGMGYVGAVTAAALARRGGQVIGVETNPTKLALLRQGKSPIREPGLDAALSHARSANLFDATDDLALATADADVVMIAVGTPSDKAGHVDLQAMDRVVEQLAAATAARPRRRVVMVRSTVPPGTTKNRVTPRLKAACELTAVCHHPEFLREGSALSDWLSPAMIVFGCEEADRATVEHVMTQMYQGIAATRQSLQPAESELMKYACNVFHALKINFANEIGALAAACQADPARVMAAFCKDTRLNISPAYLKPGFCFGGSCLPKDTRALNALGHEHQIDLPLLGSVMASNEAHLARQVQRIMAKGRQLTLLVGLSFKTGTDDLRESPMVELAERLLGKGLPLSIYDADLCPDQLIGANARYVQEHLPHLKLLLKADLSEALAQAQVVILAKPLGEWSDAVRTTLKDKTIIDLTGQGRNRSPAGSDLRVDDQRVAA